MFTSIGYFKGGYCPFYQHGLCHRPYCHFKHAIIPAISKPSTPPASTSIATTTNSKPIEPPVTSPASTDKNVKEDDVMKIVKNISSSKLMEYAKKKQEEKELKKVLELIDKENKERDNKKSVRCYSTSSSDGENHSGLINTFYNNTKACDIGTFTSHDNLNANDSTKQTLSNITSALKPPRQRRICECDDPDCTGFIEEEDEVNANISIDTTEPIQPGKETTTDGDLAKEKVGKFSDVDFFGCAADSNTKKKKKKKRIAQKQNIEEDSVTTTTTTTSSSASTKRKKDSSKDDKQNNPNKKKKRNSSENSDAQEKEQFEIVFLREEEEDDHSRNKAKVVEDNLKTNDYISVDSTPTTGQGSRKKRMAHSSEEVIRGRIQRSKPPSNTKKLSYVSPGLLSASATKQPTNITPVDVPAIPASMGFSTDSGVYVGKKRTAHSNPNNTMAAPATNQKTVRPKLPMEIGGKIPHLLRQRYLDKIIDELIPKCESEKVAIEKGFAEESVVNQRSSRKQIYMNLCANVIKKVRGMPVYVPPATTTTRANPMKSGEPTVANSSRIKAGAISGYKKVNALHNGGRSAVKPVGSLLLATVNSDTDFSQKNTSQRRLSEPVQLCEENFYNYLEQFLLSDGQRWENNYPRYHAGVETLTEIKDYTPQTNPLKRTCCRCGKEYFMNKKGKYITREECKYHWGRLRKRREKGSLYSYFSCCQSDGSGEPCSLAILHVSNNVNPLTDFTSSDTWDNEDACGKVFSLDCEMSYTTQGLELTRVTVVDFNLEQTVDLFVKPTNPIVDYNTRFSGVTKENLKHIDTSLQNIHDIFTQLFHRNTILMGHSLESDLKALKVIHDRVVDTALVFPHRLGLPFKRALRTLMGDYLHKIIQDGEGGHDSCEDARACMELMKYKFNEDNKKFNRTHTTQNISSRSFYSNHSV